MNLKFSNANSHFLCLWLCFMKREIKGCSYISVSQEVVELVAKSRVSRSFLLGYVTMGKLLNLPMPWLLYVSNGDENSTYFIGLLQVLTELYVNRLEQCQGT